MKNIAAALVSFLLLTGFSPGDTVPANAVCTTVDPVMRLIKASEVGAVESNSVFNEIMAGGDCAFLPWPVEAHLVDLFYSTQDMDGTWVEVWSVTLGDGGAKTFYFWTFPPDGPSNRHKKGGT